MANITFRLPGREQYSYAEVSFDTNEPDYVQETVQAILKDALADLDAVYPETGRQTAPAADQTYTAPAATVVPVPPGTPESMTCKHGLRKHSKGTSGKGTPKEKNWQALFCPQPKGAPSCSPKWLTAGEPGWQW